MDRLLADGHIVDVVMNRMTIEDIHQMFDRSPDAELSELIYDEIFNRRPALAVRSLKLFAGSLKSVTVLHSFVDDSHNLVFRIRINLLMKFVQTLSRFRGQLADARMITDDLIRLGSDFTINEKYDNIMKLLVHNVAIKLCSIDSRIDWQFQYIWFLVQKSEFRRSVVFRELPDYWCGRAVSRLKRIDTTGDVKRDNCRKFVIMLLISGNFADFDRRLKPDVLNELDTDSLRLLLLYGFDFKKSLIDHHNSWSNNNNNVNHINSHNQSSVVVNCSDDDKLYSDDMYKVSKVLDKYPNLDEFLRVNQYFCRPLPLKHLIRIYYRRRESTNLNDYVLRLFRTDLIPQLIADFMRYKEFIEF